MRGTQVKIPPMCVVCGKYARKTGEILKTFVFKRRVVEVKLTVPLCYTHEAYADPVSRFYCPENQKAIRNSVLLSRYWLRKDVLELTFSNEQVAERVAVDNAANLLTPLPRQALYVIMAHILCHDVRLNDMLETSMLSDHVPSEEEARQVVYPQINPFLAKHSCDGCLYDLLGIDIF
jgi:hypothetical protein